jgi:serine/threonine-protein kinase
MDHTVAIKVLHPELSSDQVAMERFRREARAAVQIHHQNAVAVTDFGVTMGNTVAYLVMEFLEGLDLRQKIKQQRLLGFDETYYITRQICAALHAAHAKGIIHRDLKPDNIWIIEGPDGSEQVKVLDFGIAKLKSTTGMINLTQQGAIVGTPHYMSPEQCQGEELDARSDIYSLGIIIYEMLTGEVPFQAPTPVGVAIKHATEHPNPPRWTRLDLPEQVENVVLRALEKKRERRQTTTVQLAQEFEAALYASGISYIPSPVSTPASPMVGAARPSEFRHPDEPSPNTPAPFTGMTPQRPTTPVGGPAPEWNEPPGAADDSVYRSAISFDHLQPADSQSGSSNSNPSWPSMPPVPAPQPSIEASDHSFSQSEASFSSRPPISTSRLLITPETLPERIFGLIARYKKPLIGVLVVALAIAGAVLAIAISKKAQQPPAPPQPPPPPPGMVFIRGNSFIMGTDDLRGDYQSKPAHVVRVNDFFLDINEVTNEEYQRFVKEKNHPAPPHWKNGQYKPGTSKAPVVNVSWSDARAYAEWAGKRLPTEAEWEYSARGDTGLLYPWGNYPSSVHANLKESGLKEPAAVGSYPDGVSWCGAKDLAGNVAEWIADDWNPYPGSRIKSDPRLKIFRGGSFINSKDDLVITNRYFDSPTKKLHHVGFRCAK